MRLPEDRQSKGSFISPSNVLPPPPPPRAMKRLSEEVSLVGKMETITVGDLRKMPGEVLACVMLGKIFLITKNGEPVAVLSKPPGETLSMSVDEHGKISYILPS